MTPEEQRIVDETTDPGGLVYPGAPPVAEHLRTDTSVEAAMKRNRRQCEQWNIEIQQRKEAAEREENARKAVVAAAEHRAFRESLFRRTAHRVGQKDAEARKQKFIDALMKKRAARGM